MFRKVDQQRGVGRVCADEEAAVRLTLGRGEQSEVGGEEAVWEGRENFSNNSRGPPNCAGGKLTYFWCVISLWSECGCLC